MECGAVLRLLGRGRAVKVPLCSLTLTPAMARLPNAFSQVRAESPRPLLVLFSPLVSCCALTSPNALLRGFPHWPDLVRSPLGQLLAPPCIPSPLGLSPYPPPLLSLYPEYVSAPSLPKSGILIHSRKSDVCWTMHPFSSRSAFLSHYPQGSQSISDAASF